MSAFVCGCEFDPYCPSNHEAAARRFLALTETGPDYEAAAKALYNAKSEVVSGSWPRWEDLRSAARALHLGNAKAVVDAALADYLTEEE